MRARGRTWRRPRGFRRSASRKVAPPAGWCSRAASSTIVNTRTRSGRGAKRRGYEGRQFEGPAPAGDEGGPRPGDGRDRRAARRASVAGGAGRLVGEGPPQPPDRLRRVPLLRDRPRITGRADRLPERGRRADGRAERADGDAAAAP